MDFNGADAQDAAFDLIPAGTIAKICLTVRPGGAGPEGWLTQSKTSPALYLNTEAVILEGPHARRRIYTRIGFKGKSLNERGEDTYANRGRAMIRGILKSARGIKASDMSETAKAARKIRSLGELSGIDLVAKIGIEKDKDKPEDTGRNALKAAIGPDHSAYIKVMGAMPDPSARPSMGSDTPSPRMGDDPFASPAETPGGNAPFWAV